ncbi:MAG TPA: guanylate kinase [Proteobacteria bacterium]|nr:guanylate kinase [Pseudomonadota bacterium]
MDEGREDPRCSSLIFVLTGASGSGKTTLAKAVCDEDRAVRFSISHTTRPRRPKEIDGVDYHFVSRDAFLDMVAEGRFVEWAEIHGYMYGTSWDEIERARSDGVDLICEIEGFGACQIKAAFPLNTVLIYLLPPSMEELKRRMTSRGQDAPEEIERRYRNAIEEMEFARIFDYLVINRDFDEAKRDLLAIVRAERLKRVVRSDVLERFLGSTEEER